MSLPFSTIVLVSCLETYASAHFDLTTGHKHQLENRLSPKGHDWWNYLVVAGGYSYDKVLSSCEIFNFSRRSWSYGAEMAQGVGNAAFTSYNNELYVSCGQYSEHGVYTSDKIQKFNIFSNQWCIITRYISPGEWFFFSWLIKYDSFQNQFEPESDCNRRFSVLSICRIRNVLLCVKW